MGTWQKRWWRAARSQRSLFARRRSADLTDAHTVGHSESARAPPRACAVSASGGGRGAGQRGPAAGVHHRHLRLRSLEPPDVASLSGTPREPGERQPTGLRAAPTPAGGSRHQQRAPGGGGLPKPEGMGAHAAGSGRTAVLSSGSPRGPAGRAWRPTVSTPERGGVRARWAPQLQLGPCGVTCLFCSQQRARGPCLRALLMRLNSPYCLSEDYAIKAFWNCRFSTAHKKTMI